MASSKRDGFGDAGNKATYARLLLSDVRAHRRRAIAGIRDIQVAQFQQRLKSRLHRLQIVWRGRENSLRSAVNWRRKRGARRAAINERNVLTGFHALAREKQFRGKITG